MREADPVHTDVRYQKHDTPIRGIFVFALLLTLLGLLVHAGVSWQFSSLKESEARKYPPLPSLAARERVHFPSDLKKIPPPRLQESEALDLAKQRQAEEAHLNSYGWVDRKEGVVRIPVAEAMKMLADPQTAASKGIRIRPQKENKK